MEHAAQRLRVARELLRVQVRQVYVDLGIPQLGLLVKLVVAHRVVFVDGGDSALRLILLRRLRALDNVEHKGLQLALVRVGFGRLDAHLHLLAETMRRAFADRGPWAGFLGNGSRLRGMAARGLLRPTPTLQ